MSRWLTISQVLFNLRIGGVLRPEVMATIDEKFCNDRHRCIQESEQTAQTGEAKAYVGD